MMRVGKIEESNSYCRFMNIIEIFGEGAFMHKELELKQVLSR